MEKAEPLVKALTDDPAADGLQDPAAERERKAKQEEADRLALEAHQAARRTLAQRFEAAEQTVGSIAGGIIEAVATGE